MPRGRRLTKKAVTEALQAHGGIISDAARSLGVARGSLSRFVSRSPELRRLVEELREDTIDIAESGLRDALRDGRGWAIQFVLESLGKRRGYIRRLPDVVAVSNLDGIRALLRQLGAPDVDELTLIEAVEQVRASEAALRQAG